ncbi:MAG: adenylate/guanylate cyclase domain-containing protein [Deltaproteobacteria bacterium]|nr:adenylate/guanylate cyclase domain-containing protein [Deltaproteobacteria bacterium]
MGASDVWAPVARALLGAAAFTPLDVARKAGLDPDQARRLWRALGFPPVADDERLFTRSDVEILRAVRELIETQSAHPDDVLQLTRVIGQSLARVADAQVTVSADRLERLRAEAVSDDAALAELADRIEALAPSLEQFLGYVWRRHLLAALLRSSAKPSESDRSLVVGFADLVGFTAMSEALNARELAETVERFEAIAYEHIPERGGRVVKMIGDEVMFASEDVAMAAEIALALAEGYARDADLPGVRVGLASGPTLTWEGDLYGPTVNLASRLVNLARPNTVLVSEELGKQLQADSRFALHRLRSLSLRGIGRVHMWVLRGSPTEK